MEKSIETKRELAKKRVAEIKGFFRHLKIFLVVNGGLFILKKGWLLPLLPDGFPQETYYFEWVDLHIVIWGIILAVHGITLYRHKITFLKKWEDRQIKKYMDEERTESRKYK